MKKNSLLFLLLLIIPIVYGSWLSPQPPPPYGTGSNITNIYNTTNVINNFNNSVVFWNLTGNTLHPIDYNNIVNVKTINATNGYFLELNVSNNSIYLGNIKMSSNDSTLLVGGNLSATFYYGSGKYLTDVNITNIDGSIVIAGNVSITGNLYMNNNSIFDVKIFCMNGICISNISNLTGPQGPAGPAGPAGAAGNITIFSIYSNYTNIYGSSLSLTDGVANRKYNFSNLAFVYMDNSILHPTKDYTYDGVTITFLPLIWDTDYLTLYYVSKNINTTNYLGSVLTGTDGSASRTLTTNYPMIIALDNSVLHPTKDYTYSGNTVTFNMLIWDTDYITIWTGE